MRHFLGASLLLATTLAAPGQAAAATLGLTTLDPVVSSSTAMVDYTLFGPDADLSTFGAVVDSFDGVTPVGAATLSLSVGFAADDPTQSSDFAFGGFLDISDDDGQLLIGDLAAIGFTDNRIEFQFDNLSGSAAGLFGSSVLATLLFTNLGQDPFAGLIDGDMVAARISVENVAAVPLPAGLPLLTVALVGFGVLSRRGARGRGTVAT